MTTQNLVLLPGLLCDQTVWQHQIDGIQDLANSSCVDYGTADSLVEMAKLVLRQAPPAFALAGHSMGGRVALEVCRLAPERVLRVALFDTGYLAKPAGEPGEREAQGRYALLAISKQEGMRAMAEQWLPPMLHPSRHTDASLVEEIISMIARKTPEIHAAQTKALLDRPDASELLATIRCPSLLLTGEQDSWSPPSAHAAMAAAIPNSTLVVIPECGHMATMERPEAVTAAMRDWLAAPPRVA